MNIKTLNQKIAPIISAKKGDKQPKPPRHLSAGMKKWWASVVSKYFLEDHHVLLLTKAAEAHDRADAARKIIEEKGLTYLDRFGQPRARPEIAVERDSRLAFVRVVRELNLAEEDLPENRPPRLAYGR